MHAIGTVRVRQDYGGGAGRWPQSGAWRASSSFATANSHAFNLDSNARKLVTHFLPLVGSRFDLRTVAPLSFGRCHCYYFPCFGSG